MITGALLLVLFLAIAGCMGQSTPSRPPSPPPSILVDYTRTGGISGENDHLVVFTNGEAIYSTRSGSGDFTLSPAELGSLQTLIDRADFLNLSAQYPAQHPGADYFSYTLTAGNRTVATETTGVPPSLSPVISWLEQALARAKQTQ